MIMINDTQELINKIDIAREWAKKHFNAGEAEGPDLLLFLDNEDIEFPPPSAFVEFPSIDMMLVSPSIMGNPSGIVISYRLSFRNNGTMAWNCLHAKSPPLEVLNDTSSSA